MKYIVLLLLCIISTSTYSQLGLNEFPASPENFEKVVGYSDLTETQFDTLYDVTFMYCRTNMDTCKILMDHSIEKLKDREDMKEQYARVISLKGGFLSYMGQDSLGEILTLEALDLFEEVRNKKEVAKINMELGQRYMVKGEYEKAMNYQLTSIKILREEKDTVKIVYPLKGLGNIYFYLGDLDKMEYYLNEASRLAEANSNYRTYIDVLGDMSVFYSSTGLDYFAKADTSKWNASTYRDSANLYISKALANGEKALQIARGSKIKSSALIPLTALAEIKIITGEYKEAETMALEGLGIANKAGVLPYMSRLNQAVADAKLGLGQYRDALKYGKEAYRFTEQSNKAENLQDVNESLFRIYKEMGNSKEALAKLEEIVAYQKEKNTTTTKNAVAEAETKYFTAEKEKEILKQKNDILELAAQNAKIQRQKKYMMGGGVLFGLLGFIGYRFNKIRKDRNDKKEFAEALIFAQEEERKRIARDLHDGVGQSLLLIKKQLSQTAEVTSENQKMISDTLEEVRSISRDLHPFQLDKFGLTATIKDTILKIEQSTELFITKEIDDIDKVLIAKSEIHLYRTIQEALSNIVKHAEATAAKVNIKNEANRISVRVQDNGKGFDLELAVVTSKSLGIRTMHERISAIGGELKFSKGENGGTDLMIVIPK